MRRSILCVVLAIFLVFSVATKGSEEISTSEEITVYCYDSFAGDWGPGNQVCSAFTEKTGIKVNLISSGSATEVLQKIQYEGNSTPADVIIGLEDSQKVDFSLFEPVELSDDITLAASLSVQNSVLVPFDYGVFSFVVDTTKLTDLPTSLEDLTDPKYKGKVILIDPRTSSVGLGLLLWSIDVFGDEYLSWWQKMKDNALTIADSWSSGYGLFTEGEAPLVISYTTSPVYHVMFEDTTTIRAIEFSEGHHECIEYAGILKSSDSKAAAQSFINFLLTEGQETIAVANSMFPANANCTLPSAFDYAIVPKMLFSSDRESLIENSQRYLDQWAEVMVR